ncbi:unnamed protein product [Oikopleura dioica]|uniref:Uncharacterized protein n=1 Tax=Oikopleura dioica TaxID=34765 RepID=E4YD22_OIKDI|nr:unnamed protein product [Oikopleura dioica]
MAQVAPEEVIPIEVPEHEGTVDKGLIKLSNNIDWFLDPPESPSDESLDFNKQYESTTFWQAARDGDCQIIEQKIKYQYRGGKRKYLKRDINLLDSMKLAPLHYAAKYGRHDAAKLLIHNGADLLLSGDDGCLPIHLAVKYRPDAFTKIESQIGEFEEQLAPADKRDRSKSIGFSSDGFLQTLELLIREGIPLDPDIVSADDAYGDSPLHYAVYRSNDNAAKMLLEKQADIDDCDKSNATPLHYLAKNGDLEMFNLFIEYEANLSHKDDDGTTAFHLAVSGGHLQFLDVLFTSIRSGRIRYDGLSGDEGVKKCILERDNEDLSCLHYAIRARNTTEVLTFLLDELERLGLKELINHQTKQTRDTVLHLAAEEGGCHNWTKIFCSSGLLPILFEKFSPIRPIAGPILFANWRQLANRPIGGKSPIGQNWPIGRISPIGPIFSELLFV